jgi:tRNA A37 threonylcarbamoyladenosine modification protein TsaB
VPTALVVAESMSPDHAAVAGDGPTLVALASKRGSFWSTRLERSTESWSIVGTPGLADADTLDLADVTALFGDRYLPDPVRTTCRAAHVKVLDPSFDPAACLRIATHLLAADQTVDPLALKPLYPREPEAVSLWERRRGDSASR